MRIARTGLGDYLANDWFRYTEKYGNTFNMRVMFEDRVRISIAPLASPFINP